MNGKHWLTRRTTIRKLWFGFGAVLAALVLLDFFVVHPAKFSLDGWFGFYPIFGFAVCVALVYGAKALGLLLKRPEDYYDFERQGEEETRR
jgi:hypothetical protein